MSDTQLPVAQRAEPLDAVHVHTIGPTSDRTQRLITRVAENQYVESKNAKTFRIFASCMMSCFGVTGAACLIWLGVAMSKS